MCHLACDIGVLLDEYNHSRIFEQEFEALLRSLRMDCADR
jgi:hypothetical protein